MHAIVDYLCRYNKSYEDKDNKLYAVKMAQEFIRIRKCAPDGDKTYDSSKLEQTWLEYKHAAPYIYTFHPCYRLYFRYAKKLKERKKKVKIVDVFNFVQRAASNQRILTRLIGQAAYVAGILDSTNVRDVRTKDFKDLPAVAPPIQSFSDEERALLKNFDPHSPIR